VLRLPVHLGVGGALRVGFRFAVANGYDVVAQCDADGQHPPEQITGLLAAQARTEAHLLIGSRFVSRGESFPIRWPRRATMRLFSWLVRVRSGQRVADTTSGFRCIAEPLLSAFARSFPTHYLGDTFEAVLVAARSGYRIAEEPVRMEAREVGRSKASLGAALQSVARAAIVAVGGLTFRLDPLDRTSPSGDVEAASGRSATGAAATTVAVARGEPTGLAAGDGVSRGSPASTASRSSVAGPDRGSVRVRGAPEPRSRSRSS
jgi:hypothetical protein